VLKARPHKNLCLLTLEGIDSVEKADALRGQTLFFKRGDARLAEDTYFIAELLGCRVIDANDPEKEYGTLCDVSQTGANDVWHIRGADGKETLIPLIDEVVRRVDVAADVIEITPIPGLFEDPSA